MTKNFKRATQYAILRQHMTVQEIKDWKVPDNLLIRAEELLDKNNAGTLTLSEQTELERLRQMDVSLCIMKLKAEHELRENANKLKSSYYHNKPKQ